MIVYQMHASHSCNPELASHYPLFNRTHPNGPTSSNRHHHLIYKHPPYKRIHPMRRTHFRIATVQSIQGSGSLCTEGCPARSRGCGLVGTSSPVARYVPRWFLCDFFDFPMKSTDFLLEGQKLDHNSQILQSPGFPVKFRRF
jgi:hypothetical protein